MLLSPTFAAFIGLSLVFLWAQSERGRVGLWIRSGALFGLVASLFLIGEASPNRESLSVHLRALGAVPGMPVDDALIVGDHHDYADFVVMPYANDTLIKPLTGTHHDFVTVSTRAHKVFLHTTPGDTETGRPAMAVAWRLEGQPLRFDGAIELGKTASICLDKACGKPFRFDAGDWKQTLAGTDGAIKGARPYYFQKVFRPSAFGARQSVIFYTPGGRWYLLPLDRDVRLVSGSAPGTQAPELVAGKPIHVSLFRIDVPDPELDAPVRMVSRQSFTIADTVQGVYLTPKAPLISSAGSCSNPRLTLTRLSATSRIADYGTPEQILTFAALGNGSLKADGSYRAYSPLNRADDGPLLGKAASLCTYRGRDFSVTGQRLNVIKTNADDDAPLKFSVQGMRIPWLMLAFVLAGLVIADRAAAQGKSHRSETVLLGLMQYLLTLRLLIGVRGTLMDPQIVPSDVFSDVTAAFVGLPVAFVGLRSVRELGMKSRLVLACVLSGLYGLIWLWTGSLDRPFLTVMLISAGGLAWPVFIPVVQQVRAIATQPHALLDRGKRIWSDIAGWCDRHHLPALAIALIVGVSVLRMIAYMVFGIRERAVVAVSLPYLAVLLPGLALYLAFAGKSAIKTVWQPVLFGALVFLSVVFVPSITRDHGFAIIQTFPMVALAFVEALRWQKGGWPKVLWAAGLPAALALFAALLWVFPYIHGAPPEGDVLKGLDYALKFNDSNDIRLLHQFHADLVTRFPTKVAVANTQFWLDLQTFTASLTGSGYLTNQNLGAFGYQALHFSDNLSAVHIMHPFGRFGAVAVLAILIFSVRLAMETDPPGPASGARLTARLALWTFAFAAIYMVLANLGLVPFTGRNIYLLAVSSGSDLAEGFMLLAMAAVTLSRARSS